MNKEAILVELRDKYRDRDWFYDAGYDQYGRPTIYIKFECHETIWDIPDTIQGKQILVHYATSVKGGGYDFVDRPQQSTLPIINFKAIWDAGKEAQKRGIDTGFIGAMDGDIDEFFADLAKKNAEAEDKALEESVQILIDELDRLEKICGSNILADIFFEENDGKNAVTNLSVRFPEVREKMHKLFTKYGFDSIYNELEL